jgi:hypothetical protein
LDSKLEDKRFLSSLFDAARLQPRLFK